MNEAFTVQENPNGKFIISLSEKFHTDFPDFICHQSYLIFAARLLGMTYPSFVRYCAMHGGELVGRQGYPAIYFKSKTDAKSIVKLINSNYELFSTALIP